MTAAVDLRLPPGPESVPRARRALDPLAGKVDPSVLDRARLMVSELVTNAIRHAGLGPDDRISLRVSVVGGSLRTEVRDAGPGFTPGRRPITIYQQSGWGLYLVAQLADRWGVTKDGDVCVWFEIDGLGAEGL